MKRLSGPGLSARLAVGALGLLCAPATLRSQTVTTFQVQNQANMYGSIIAGPDQAIWTADQYGLIRFTLAGSQARFPVAVQGQVFQLAAGSDGNIWFTELYSDRIGRMTPTGDLTEFQVPAPDSDSISGICRGPDGNLWVTVDDPAGGHLARITTEGSVTEFPVAAPHLYGIAAGSDGNFWISESTGQIARITPAGNVTEFPLPASILAADLIAGPDGNVWFSETGSSLGRITPEGVITALPVPQGEYASALASGPDGNVWFAYGYSSFGRMTPSGAVTIFSTELPPPSPSIRGITFGPDGHLWFTLATSYAPQFPGPDYVGYMRIPAASRPLSPSSIGSATRCPPPCPRAPGASP